MPAVRKIRQVEWANAEQVFDQFGFSKGTLNKLADLGRIKSVSIKTKAGARKGVRLFSIASIRELLADSL
jgi:hypothetical protein